MVSAEMASPSTSDKGDKGPRTAAVKTLQELTARKTLRQLENDEQAVATITDLDSDTQHVLLTHLWKDYIRLRKKERAYDYAVSKCPLADRDIIFDPMVALPTFEIDHPNLPRADAGWDASGVHPITKYFRGLWKPISYPSHHYDIYEWDASNLTMSPGPERHFKLCHCYSSDITSVHVTPFRPCQACMYRRDELDNVFTTSISSQLLFYRLTMVFGQSLTDPRDHHDYGCWQFTLQSRRCSHSTLALRDYMGGVDVWFEGNKEETESALLLLNWLISARVPNMDEMVFLAGAQSWEDQMHEQPEPVVERG